MTIVLNGNDCDPKILYLAKLSFLYEENRKIFSPSFIYYTRYLSSYSVPGNVLGIEDKKVKTQI